MRFSVQLSDGEGMGNPVEVTNAQYMFETLAVGDTVNLGVLNNSATVIGKYYSVDWSTSGEHGVLLIKEKI